MYAIGPREPSTSVHGNPTPPPCSVFPAAARPTLLISTACLAPPHTPQSLRVSELLEAFPSCAPTLALLAAALPPLAARFYSIASSPLDRGSSADGTAMSVVFSVDEWEHDFPSTAGEGEGAGDAATPTLRRFGLATPWLERCLARHLHPASAAGPAPLPTAVLASLKPASDFTLPSDPRCPVVMVGPGTGVAPFMGFIRHRQIQREAAAAAAVASSAVAEGANSAATTTASASAQAVLVSARAAAWSSRAAATEARAEAAAAREEVALCAGAANEAAAEAAAAEAAFVAAEAATAAAVEAKFGAHSPPRANMKAAATTVTSSAEAAAEAAAMEAAAETGGGGGHTPPKSKRGRRSKRDKLPPTPVRATEQGATAAISAAAIAAADDDDDASADGADAARIAAAAAASARDGAVKVARGEANALATAVARCRELEAEAEAAEAAAEAAEAAAVNAAEVAAAEAAVAARAGGGCGGGAHASAEGFGPMTLYFGCRHEAQDYLYRPELEGALADGTLAALRTAFSRDGPDKVYVQHRIKEDGATLRPLLLAGTKAGGGDEGGAAAAAAPRAYVYVCGDGSRMAKDVHAALLAILVGSGSGGGGGGEGNLSEAEAEAVLVELKSQGRYVQDVWSV